MIRRFLVYFFFVPSETSVIKCHGYDFTAVHTTDDSVALFTILLRLMMHSIHVAI
jgi:hypothetical protein